MLARDKNTLYCKQNLKDNNKQDNNNKGNKRKIKEKEFNKRKFKNLFKLLQFNNNNHK
jgi:hypothetical protein